MSNAPDAGAGQQDFIKGWPKRELIDYPGLKAALVESFLYYSLFLNYD
jgi:hypothetical protein